MANNEFDVEHRAAGLDMVPLGELFEWNGPDDGAPILPDDFDLNLSAQGAIPLGEEF